MIPYGFNNSVGPAPVPISQTGSNTITTKEDPEKQSARESLVNEGSDVNIEDITPILETPSITSPPPSTDLPSSIEIDDAVSLNQPPSTTVVESATRPGELNISATLDDDNSFTHISNQDYENFNYLNTKSDVKIPEVVKFQLVPFAEEGVEINKSVEFTERSLKDGMIMRIGRQVVKDGKTVPAVNGKNPELDVWYTSKVVSRIHAEMWSKDGQVRKPLDENRKSCAFAHMFFFFSFSFFFLLRLFMSIYSCILKILGAHLAPS